jgi:dephospho-CoA kinase
MIRLGLTGSIGMGKSTTGAMFVARGCPLHDADATVHRLYEGRAAPLIEAAFPGTTSNGKVDRQALGQRVLGDRSAMAKLEAIVHPMVREEEAAFFRKANEEGTDIVILDIPLLFETGAEGRCDKIVVVSAPEDVQKARVLARPDMTEEKFEAIKARQIPDVEKRARADFVIETGKGLEAAERQVDAILATLRQGA